MKTRISFVQFLSVSTLFLIIAAGTLSAEIVPALNLRSLVDSADLIVLGRVSALTDLGQASTDGSGDLDGRLMTGRIAVRQVLKGPRQDSVEFWSPVWRGALRVGEIAPDVDGVFMLKRRATNLEFVSPFYPVLRTVVGPRIEAAEPLEAVVEAMSMAFQVPTASVSMKRRTIYDLGRIPLPAAVPALRMASRDSNREIHLAALTALLANNDVEALSQAEAVLLQTRVLDPAEANLRYGLRGLKDAAAVPALTRLLTRGDVETRRAAAVALGGQTQSNAALRALGRALDDEDFEVRFNAVQSLADVHRQVGLRTTPESFRENEQRQKAEWKERLKALGVDLP